VAHRSESCHSQRWNSIIATTSCNGPSARYDRMTLLTHENHRRREATMMFDHTWAPGDAEEVLGLLEQWASPAERSAAQVAFLALASDQLAVSKARSPSWARLSREAGAEAFRCLIVLACFAEAIDDKSLERLRALNRAQRFGSPWPDIIGHARAGRSVRATMSMGRRAPDGKSLLRQVWKSGGLWGVLKAAAAPMGLKLADAGVARRYSGLDTYAEGTLGNRFYLHMTSRRLPLPGAPGSLQELALQHDLMHVVTGFDTDARGESRLAGFYAGVSSRFPVAGADPFTFFMVALLTFHLGYRVGPGFVAAESGSVSPRELWACYEYGAHSARSPLHDWDFGAELTLPLTEVRARFGLPPGAIAQAL
jgi:hypothetical protein